MPDSDKNKPHSYFPIETSIDKYRDWLILGTILFVGVAGLYFIIHNPVQKSKIDADKGKLISHLFEKKNANVQDQESLKSNLLEINGELKANSALDFKFQNLIDEAEYVLLLGDDRITPSDRGQISYQFKQAGVYKIQLQQKIGDEVSIVHSEYLELL